MNLKGNSNWSLEKCDQKNSIVTVTEFEHDHSLRNANGIVQIFFFLFTRINL